MNIANIWIAEGDPLLLLGLKIDLARTGEFRVVGEARNAAAAASGYIMRSIENCKIVAIINYYLSENSVELSQLEELNGHFAFVC